MNIQTTTSHSQLNVADTADLYNIVLPVRSTLASAFDKEISQLTEVAVCAPCVFSAICWASRGEEMHAQGTPVNA